jgi:hypothetical protein
MQAFGVAEAARVTGRRIPEDLSVVGFDDLPISRWVSPPLTTVRQPLAEMGRTAAEMLLAMIDQRELHSRRVELATELIVRSSTAPVAIQDPTELRRLAAEQTLRHRELGSDTWLKPMACPPHREGESS